VHPHHEHVLVVGPIEDADASALGHLRKVSPEKIVREFFMGRLLEREDIAPLRIDARHDVLDRPVLAAASMA
jgi:hypothetical protein